MRKVIKKVFFVWDFDKEEKWLNEMAAQGLALVSVGFCKYEFEDAVPGEYGVCLQLLENNCNHPTSQKCIEFLEETGAEHVGSWLRWAYFRKKKADGAFELFSDNDSRIKHLSQVLVLLGIITGMNLWVGFYNLFLFAVWRNGINLLCFINLAIGIWGTFGFYRLYKKRKRLKADQQLFE